MEHEHLTPRASQILHALGLPEKHLEPVESYSNAVWLTRDYVIHYHVIGPSGRLEHEARVAACLLPEALYPEVIAVGRDGDHDWLVTKRVPGVPLSAAWPSMTCAERRDSLHQVAHALKAVHASPAQSLVPPCLQGGVPVLSRQALSDKLYTLHIPTKFKQILSSAGPPSVMAHGDFNFNQVMWYEGHVTGLLDLEMSHAEEPDWDVVPFLAFCHNPVRMVPEHLAASTIAEDYRDAPFWLMEAYPEMFTSPSLKNRIALYALVLRSTEMFADPSICEEIIITSITWAGELVAMLLNR